MRTISALMLLLCLTGAGMAEESSKFQLRFDGLYELKERDCNSYLRFYEDGTVVEACSTGSPEEAGRWLNKDHPYSSKGIYILTGSVLSFAVKSASGPDVSFVGQVARDGLTLDLIETIHTPGSLSTPVPGKRFEFAKS